MTVSLFIAWIGKFLLCYVNIGPPGAGKSTTAQRMARSHGYVYYEADCFFMFVNPFVDINAEEASLAMAAQKPLKVLF